MGDARSKAVTMTSKKKAFLRKEESPRCCRVPRLHPSQNPGLSIPSPAFFSRQIPSNIPAAPRAEVVKSESRTARVRRRGVRVRRVCRARAYRNGMIVRRRERGVDSVVRGWITETGRGLARAPSAAPGASASASGRRSSRRRRCCSCQSLSSSSATPPSGTCVFLLPCHLF